jgi:acyl carrier protein
MDRTQHILAVIYRAIDEVNEVRVQEEWIKKEPDEELIGPGSMLDSLSLLNLVMTVEEKINETFNVTVDLTGTLAMEPVSSSLRTIAVFANYIGARLEA